MTPMVSSKYQAVIFDLDGVLTDTAHYHFVAWQEMAATVGVVLDQAFNERLKGVDRMGSLALILAQSSRRFSQAEVQALAASKNQRYLELIADMSPADLLPGALATLRWLNHAGILTGLASASKNALSVLDSLRIRGYFNTVVDANTVLNGKPDPEIFLRAAQQLGVAPAVCLGVEDSIAGVQSIKSAGMVALGIGAAQVLTQADYVIPDLSRFDLSQY